MSAAEDAANDALTAALLLAIDPGGLGGAVLRSGPGPARDAWLALLRDSLPREAPFRRAPVAIDDEQMFGGVDLPATVLAGRPVARQGLAEACTGGVLVLAMAERLAAGVAARIGVFLDVGALSVVALDEGIEADERPPAALRERLAFEMSLEGVRIESRRIAGAEVERARARLAQMQPASIGDIERVCAACAEFGIGSARAAIFSLAAARASAALAAREQPSERDWTLAARLVLAPRARLRAVEESAAPPEQENDGAAQNENEGRDTETGDRLVEAVRSALPSGFLDEVFDNQRRRAETKRRGAGAAAKSAQRGRPTGVRPARGRGGERLDIVATLRTAAPWQPLRRRERPNYEGAIQVRPSDFRVRKYVQRLESTIVFAVDASGSTALQRLAEAKGAAETLLADAYVTRARVALIAFRDRAAQMLLPPTRSLARAKRALADLPGGGGTPLAIAIDAASMLAQSERAKGRSSLVVFLSDGRGNIGRNGEPGRDAAERDALAAARALNGAGLTSVFIDTSPRARPEAASLAAAMGARYAILPHADAAAVANVVRAHAPRRP